MKTIKKTITVLLVLLICHCTSDGTGTIGSAFTINDESYRTICAKSRANWLKILVRMGLAIFLCWLAALAIVAALNLDAPYLFYLMGPGIPALLYWIGRAGIARSRGPQKNRIAELESPPAAGPRANRSKNFDKIEGFIKANRAYLNPDLSLETLSEELGLSEGYISRAINKSANLSFNDYINGLRINESKKMLKEPKYINYTIASIGRETGFSSKSSFYAAFRKFTGKSPSEYKKSVRNLELGCPES